MYDNEWHAIIDYEIVEKKKAKKKKKRKEFIFEVAKEMLSERLWADFCLAYLKIEDSIKSLHIDKQFEIVLSSLGLAYDASSHAYSRISSILNGKDPDEEIKDEILKLD